MYSSSDRSNLRCLYIRQKIGSTDRTTFTFLSWYNKVCLISNPVSMQTGYGLATVHDRMRSVTRSLYHGRYPRVSSSDLLTGRMD